jgi:cyclophilin family peptidyl-prolyl cis-trans isomerase
MLAFLAAAVLAQPVYPEYQPTGPVIRFTMNNGRSFEIATDPKASPKTVAHILGLVKKGFYDGQRVHRVEWWVTQWGAPASRTKPLDSDDVGDGGSGITLPFERSEIDFKRGVVGIASEGLQLGGDSQLFIIKQDALRLYGSYAVVGKVVKGMDTVGSIQRGDRFKAAVVLPK